MQFIFLVLILILGDSDQRNPYCKVFGSIHEVEYPEQADFLVYEELSEASSDIIVFEETNRLYADKPGKWYFEKDQSFAKYKVYFVQKESQADFSVYFTRFESFAGCNQ